MKALRLTMVGLSILLFLVANSQLAYVEPEEVRIGIELVDRRESKEEVEQLVNVFEVEEVEERIPIEVLRGFLDLGMGLRIDPSKVLVQDLPDTVEVRIRNYGTKEKKVSINFINPFKCEEGFMPLDSSLVQPNFSDIVVGGGEEVILKVLVDCAVEGNFEAWVGVKEVTQVKVAQELIIRILVSNKEV